MKNDKEEKQNEDQNREARTNPEHIAGLMDGLMLCAIINTACFMMTELIFNFLPRQMEHMQKTLNREPTDEDWDDLIQALGERALNPKYLQRADDRENIRRMVFEEGTSQ